MQIIYSYDVNALRLLSEGELLDSVPMHKGARAFTPKRRLGIARHVYPKAFLEGATYTELKEGEGYGV